MRPLAPSNEFACVPSRPRLLAGASGAQAHYHFFLQTKDKRLDPGCRPCSLCVSQAGGGGGEVLTGGFRFLTSPLGCLGQTPTSLPPPFIFLHVLF